MTRNSSVDLDITNNAIGPTIGGGIPTERKLSWAGNGDLTLNQASTSVSSTIYSFPTASGATDNIICSSLYNAAGTVAYGTGAGTYPTALAPGTTGQALLSTGAAVTWSALPTSFVWTGISAPQTGVVGNGYYVTTGTQALTLPATAAAGTNLAIYAAKGSTGWSIVQGAGQSIQFGNVSTTVGAGGSLASSNVGDGVFLLCTTANTTWLVISSAGNPVIV